MPPATYRSHPSTGNLRTLQRGGLPPSLAPLVRNPFTQPRHCHSFIFCPVGRGLDPSAAFRPTPANSSHVGEGFIPPANLPPPPTSAGRRGRRPLPRRSVRLLIAATSPAAWSQAALHPTLPYSVGAGHARPAALPLPPVYLLHRREGS